MWNYNWYLSDAPCIDYNNKKQEKAMIDELKVLVAILSAEISNIYLTSTLPERTEEEIEIDQVKRYGVLLIRAIIVILSINNDWPLSMCVTISLVITITAIIIRISQENRNED